jgi:hypothetical protein
VIDTKPLLGDPNNLITSVFASKIGSEIYEKYELPCMFSCSLLPKNDATTPLESDEVWYGETLKGKIILTRWIGSPKICHVNLD